MNKEKLNFNSEYEEAEYYYNEFIELFNSGAEIRTKDKKTIFQPEDKEEFKQCWADTPERNTFPKQWFVSENHLLSILKKRLILIRKNTRDGEDAFYIYQIKKN